MERKPFALPELKKLKKRVSRDVIMSSMQSTSRRGLDNLAMALQGIPLLSRSEIPLPPEEIEQLRTKIQTTRGRVLLLGEHPYRDEPDPNVPTEIAIWDEDIDLGHAHVSADPGAWDGVMDTDLLNFGFSDDDTAIDFNVSFDYRFMFSAYFEGGPTRVVHHSERHPLEEITDEEGRIVSAILDSVGRRMQEPSQASK